MASIPLLQLLRPVRAFSPSKLVERSAVKAERRYIRVSHLNDLSDENGVITCRDCLIEQTLEESGMATKYGETSPAFSPCDAFEAIGDPRCEPYSSLFLVMCKNVNDEASRAHKSLMHRSTFVETGEDERRRHGY